ncbi:hypothetical protein JFK97_18920 [Chromobacterium phragmitis]|uniref:hypothetical protein n=1 Tax=Chromobacterium amazonense TaxID=1382803 RepID=UPI0021B7EF56|nr:hypothetical protein [Chromobacterium amazonense]MBM2886465.1 hypothetical protein [Chromobacterium amazonense]
MIDDPNSESWLMLLVTRQLEQRLGKMAAAKQQPVEELATNLLEAGVEAWGNSSPAEPETSWVIPLLDAGDGSGDAILELPDELLALAGWAEGDTLSFEDRGDGTLQVRKVDSEDSALVEIALQRLNDGEPPVDVKLDDL